MIQGDIREPSEEILKQLARIKTSTGADECPIKNIIMKQEFQEKRVLNDREAQSSAYKDDLCLILDTIKNSFEAFRTTNYENNVCQDFCRYYLSLQPYMTPDDIEKQCETLVARMIIQVKKASDHLKRQMESYKQFIEKHRDTVEKFKLQMDNSILIEAIRKFDDSPEGWAAFDDEVNDYVKKLHTITEKDKTDLQQRLEKMKQDQKIFLNQSVFQQEQVEMINSIERIKSYLAPSSFPNSILAGSNALTMLKNINEQYQPENDREKLKLVYRLSEHGREYQKIGQLQVSTMPALLLVVKSEAATFAVYASDPAGRNKDLWPKSFIYHLTKNFKFQYNGRTTNSAPFKLETAPVAAGDLIWIGAKDIIIKSKFEDCESTFGLDFDASGVSLGDPTEYLANRKRFKIVDLEIFEVTLAPTQSLNASLGAPQRVGPLPPGPRPGGPPPGPPSGFGALPPGPRSGGPPPGPPSGFGAPPPGRP